MTSDYFKEAFVEAGGSRIRYLDGGSGHPVVVLHGRGPVHVSPAYELLAQSFRIIAFELPQTSGSDEELARAVNAAASALGIERYSLAGISSGSNVALWMAILRPEPVDAIVLSAPEALERRAAELRQPVLVLFGTTDTSATPGGARLYREVLQNCHIMLVYGAGHAIDADRPEAFASTAGDFLTRKEQFVVRETSALIHP